MITVNTKLIPLLGKPLGQSFSPKMQNAAYEAIGVEGMYFPIEVENDHVGDVINALRYMNCPGFAITKPNKVYAMQFLDELDEFAEKIGAVNTVVNVNGKLKGYNTDGDGCVNAMVKESGFNLADTTIMCIGAGGSARAVCATLAHRGAKKLIITARRPEKAVELMEEIAAKFPQCEVDTCDFHSDEALIQAAAECQILMNHTGVGMNPYIGQTPVTKAIFKPHHFAFDAVYNPAKTQFLIEAEEAGCKIQNGIGMVLGQGAIQIKHWFGEEAPLAVMQKSVEESIAAANQK